MSGLRPPVVAVAVVLALGAVRPARAQPPPERVDLDGNGTADAFVYNPGTGVWLRQISTPAGFTGTSGMWSPGWSAAAARFDADTRTDFFLFSTTSGQWFKMLATASGFAVQASGTWSTQWERVILDLDGDGVSDVFLYDPVTGTWFKCLSTATGFTYLSGSWSPGWQVRAMTLDADDIDDMFLNNPATGQWFWVLGQQGAAFSYPRSGAWALDWSLSTGDFNGDGLTDLYLHRPGESQWYVALTGPVGFTYALGYFSPGWQPYVADLDGNGWDDLFLLSPTSGQWFWMLGNGSGAFTTSGGGFWSLWWQVQASELNGDSRDDFLLFNPISGMMFRALNGGAGTFTYQSGYWPAGSVVLSSTRPAAPTASERLETEVLTLVNQRRAAGATCGGTWYPPVGPLTMQVSLRLAARGHSQDMATRGYFAHTNPDGRTFDQRLRDVGYAGASPWGENIAAGYASPASVVTGWMNSSGHCVNVMRASFRTIGVGHALLPGSPYGQYWSQSFGGS